MINIRFVFLFVLLTNHLFSMEKLAGPVFEFCTNTVVAKILGNRVPKKTDLVEKFDTVFKNKAYYLAGAAFLRQMIVAYPDYKIHTAGLCYMLSFKIMWPELKACYAFYKEKKINTRQFEICLVHLGLTMGIVGLQEISHIFMQAAGLNNLNFDCQYSPLK